jgi:hypothetical protein
MSTAKTAEQKLAQVRVLLDRLQSDLTEIKTILKGEKT